MFKHLIHLWVLQYSHSRSLLWSDWKTTSHVSQVHASFLSLLLPLEFDAELLLLDREPFLGLPLGFVCDGVMESSLASSTLVVCLWCPPFWILSTSMFCSNLFILDAMYKRLTQNWLVVKCFTTFSSKIVCATVSYPLQTSWFSTIFLLQTRTRPDIFVTLTLIIDPTF